MIYLKKNSEIEIMREAGRILAKITSETEKEVKAGMTTKELSLIAENLMKKYGVAPAFLNYDGFPDVMCISVNEEVVHVAPSDRELKDGDIVCLDLGVKYKGYNSDMAITVAVGENVGSEAERLISVTKKCLEIGISKAKAGKHFGDIGNAIQKYAEGEGFGVVRDLCGHGIGKMLHEDPQILNYGKKGVGPIIKKGMVFCLEPMITMGTWKLKRTKDRFGYKTEDNSLAAHFEHTIAITDKGTEILTKI